MQTISMTQSRDLDVNQTAQESVGQYLTFNSGGECYALGILAIKEIIEFGHITKIPMLPLFVRGVINLRGSVVPVIDLAARLYGEQLTAGRRTCVVIVELATEDGQIELGVVVDSVNEVLELSSRDLAASPNFGSKIRTDFIQQMARVQDRLVMILALERVLSIDEMAGLVALSQEKPTAEQV